MRRKANDYDNASIESFWHPLKTECMALSQIKPLRELRKLLFEYIHLLYHPTRLPSRRGV
jgi:transposase InsO family protein